jgi:hypothetical protein
MHQTGPDRQQSGSAPERSEPGLLSNSDPPPDATTRNGPPVIVIIVVVLLVTGVVVLHLTGVIGPGSH